jgi:hypothetical protein
MRIPASLTKRNLSSRSLSIIARIHSLETSSYIFIEDDTTTPETISEDSVYSPLEITESSLSLSLTTTTMSPHETSHPNMSVKAREILSKAQRMIPPMLERFHKGECLMSEELKR